MVFCCIAIVGIAMLYFAFLTLRQLFSGPTRDQHASPLPAPPRALTGNRAKPVYGHTGLFSKLGGDVALMFPEEMLEWRFLPKSWSRALGDCFSIFIWGQWRVVIKGPERTQQILQSPGIKEGWAWSPPISLLGKSCLSLLEPDEAEFLTNMLSKPLSQRSILQYAPEFVEIAEKFVDDLLAGKCKKNMEGKLKRKGRNSTSSNESEDDCSDEQQRAEEGRYCDSSEEGDDMPTEEKTFKIKWDLLRSYTLDLVDGPLFRLNKWKKPSEQSKGETTEQGADALKAKPEGEVNSPERESMLLWMERLKSGLCSIKVTFGPEWMYVWYLNEYGRAVNARTHISNIIASQVSERAKLVPVRHDPGHSFHDPMAMPFPLITMAENVFYRNESIFGGAPKPQNRPRSRSEPSLLEDEDMSRFWGDVRFDDIPPPPFDSPSTPGSPQHHSSVRYNRPRCASSPQIIQSVKKIQDDAVGKEKSQSTSVLDELLKQVAPNGSGLSQAVTTELCILLWMMMDVGNSWTAMALNLLSMDQSACNRVQQELDHLIHVHGKEKLFTPKVMGKMQALDALLYEAIRLCPPFLGGLKVTSQTIELPDAGVQIPKNTNVIFCQPTDQAFDMTKALGKKPESLAYKYPCAEIHGFLPFGGIEIPMMLLQSKVFISVLLQRCSPFLSKKRTFIRRVKSVVLNRKVKLADEIYVKQKVNGFDDEDEDVSSLMAESSHTHVPSSDGRRTDLESMVLSKSCELTQTAAMRLFTKIPFPEPRRVLNVRERDSALQILGVTGLGY